MNKSFWYPAGRCRRHACLGVRSLCHQRYPYRRHSAYRGGNRLQLPSAVKVGDTLTNDKAAQAIKALLPQASSRTFASKSGTSWSSFSRKASGDSPDCLRRCRRNSRRIRSLKLKETVSPTVASSTGRYRKKAGTETPKYLPRGTLRRGMSPMTVTPLERNGVGKFQYRGRSGGQRFARSALLAARDFKEKISRPFRTPATPGWMTWYSKNDQYL